MGLSDSINMMASQSTFFPFVFILILGVNSQGTGCTVNSQGGICQYCNSSVSQQEPLLSYYSDICSLYPDNVYYQPVNDECNIGNTSYMANNPCCPQFPAGSHVLHLDAFTLESPFDEFPYECDEPGESINNVCNPGETYNGQWCNEYNFCAFLAGTVISSSSWPAQDGLHTHCIYEVQLDDGQAGASFVQYFGYWLEDVFFADQQYIIPYVAELAADFTPNPSLSPTRKPTPKPTNYPFGGSNAVSYRSGMMIGCIAVLSFYYVF